jgi:hypothetical protein
MGDCLSSGNENIEDRKAECPNFREKKCFGTKRTGLFHENAENLSERGVENRPILA